MSVLILHTGILSRMGAWHPLCHSSSQATPAFRRYSNALKNRDECCVLFPYHITPYTLVLFIRKLLIRGSRTLQGSLSGKHYWKSDLLDQAKYVSAIRTRRNWWLSTVAVATVSSLDMTLLERREAHCNGSSWSRSHSHITNAKSARQGSNQLMIPQPAKGKTMDESDSDDSNRNGISLKSPRAIIAIQMQQWRWWYVLRTMKIRTVNPWCCYFPECSQAASPRQKSILSRQNSFPSFWEDWLVLHQWPKLSSRKVTSLGAPVDVTLVIQTSYRG